MGTLYLHIGTPKTGTSAIQRFLYLNSEALKKQSFCYPDFGYRYSEIRKERNGHFLVHHQKSDFLSPETKKQVRQAETERFYEGLDNVKKIMETYPNVILSDENIWNGYVKKKRFWPRLAEAVSKRGIDLKVIVYLRRQDLLIESYWLQMVKGFPSCQLSLQEFIASGKYTRFKLDYYEQLQKIAKAIGKENIIVRVYEKQQYEENGNTLTSDFLQSIGVKMNDDFQKPDIVVNTRLSGSCLEVKRILNQSDYLRTNTNLMKELKKVQDELGHEECKYFSCEEQITFLKNYEQSNMNVAREFLNRKDGILFRDKITEENNTSKQSYSPEELVLICGRILEHQDEKLEKMKQNLADAKRPFCQKIARKLSHVIKTPRALASY